MYYKLNEKGEIAQTCDTELEGFSYTDEEIVSSYDGQRMLFKHETETDEYKAAEGEYMRQKTMGDLRSRREPLLLAFDKWEKAVMREREQDDEMVMSWYRNLLDLQESAFADIPERIKYYL